MASAAPKTTTYQIVLMYDGGQLFVSNDLGALWTGLTTPSLTENDPWTGLSIAVNDGDYSTLAPWDRSVDLSYPGPAFVDGRGGVEICTVADVSTQPILSYGAGQAISGAITANAQTILVPFLPLTGTARPRISSDAGATFADVTGLAAAVGWTRCCFSQNATIMYIHEYRTNNIHKSSDGGATWALCGTGGSPPALSGSNLNGKNQMYMRCGQDGSVVGVSIYGGDFWLSTDGGANWVHTQMSAQVGFPTGVTDFGLAGSTVVLGGPSTLTNQSAVLMSMDHGVTWAPKLPPSGSANSMETLGLAPDGLGIVIPYSQSNLCDISTDGGATWTTSVLPIGATAGTWVASYILPAVGPGPEPEPEPEPEPGQRLQPLRKRTYRHRFLGWAYKPSITVVKDRPGALRIIEFDAWMS